MPKETVFNPYLQSSLSLVGRIFEHPVQGVGLITGYVDRSDSDDGRGKFVVLWSGEMGVEDISESEIRKSRVLSDEGVRKTPFSDL